MKKTILGLCAVALALTACQHDGFRVNGVADGFKDGDTLYFFSEMGKDKPTDTLIIKNGKFTIEGAVDSVKLCSVVSSDASAGAIFFMEDGDIDVTVTRQGQPKVGGTKSNRAWQKVNDLQAVYSLKFDSLTAPLYMEDLNEEQKQQILAEYEATEKEMLEKVLQVAEDNLDNALGYFIVTSMAGSQELDPMRLKAMIDNMPAEYQQRQEVVDIVKAMEAAAKVAVGMPMLDFTLPDTEGNEVNVKDEVAKNKVTILDFWATWCKPCCDEMPNMVSLYGKYHDKGLGIVGVSLDTDKEAWVKGIADMKMAWKQVGDMTGWKSDCVELYQVRAIPFVVVVDQQGKILEKGLRGTALELFIEEQLK